MNLLVLGGTHFAGRAVVEAALADGIEVTTLNRGLSRIPGADVRTLIADRTDPDALRGAIGDRVWDAVIDTWSGAPDVVADSCQLLARRTGHYGTRPAPFSTSTSAIWPRGCSARPGGT